MFDKGAAFFSASYGFDFSEKFLVDDYAYVMLQSVNLLHTVYLVYKKALLAFLYKVFNSGTHENTPHIRRRPPKTHRHARRNHRPNNENANLHRRHRKPPLHKRQPPPRTFKRNPDIYRKQPQPRLHQPRRIHPRLHPHPTKI